MRAAAPPAPPHSPALIFRPGTIADFDSPLRERWVPPPLRHRYREQLDRPLIETKKRILYVSNKHDAYWDKDGVATLKENHLDLEDLLAIVQSARARGLAVVYGRAVYDPGEAAAAGIALEGYKAQPQTSLPYDDRGRIGGLDDVHFVADIAKRHGLSYNLANLRLMAQADCAVVRCRPRATPPA